MLSLFVSMAYLFVILLYSQFMQATKFFMFEVFRSSFKFLKTFNGHKDSVKSIDYSTFGDDQFICSGSDDKTVCVWDVDTGKYIQSFDGHSSYVYCVKFSKYHYYNNRSNIACSSSSDNTIRFWDIKKNKQFKIFNGHTKGVYCIEFSPFNDCKYLCSGSGDKTIRLWDVEESESVHVFNGHTDSVWCLDISPLRSNNKNESNHIGIIGGNGYTICSGSNDKTIRVWDIETIKQLNVFRGHRNTVNSVKYGPNEFGINDANTILSGSLDHSVRLWDIRSGRQIQVFNEHELRVNVVEYLPLVANKEVGYSPNVICAGSGDNTIRFWDIRSNKNELYKICGDDREYYGVLCLKFASLKEKGKNNEKSNGFHLYYGSGRGPLYVWG
ncbi:hypothetical protein RFI_31865 [Reticulomyxa filosa]|uniref:Uncharacterized protein n=1 Tax=Reticulomyxa filosa TaxID=46433 RepID=X6LWL9_RETFI|nr:hypothetical protein RFI_31865 [Reticulomyxa filosa]|eukprot:ETO05532.1 hypothetical protein RFI_31865 [Reticulomyxa filosa]